MYDSKIDVWSACVVLYILLTGEMPSYAQKKRGLDTFRWINLTTNQKDNVDSLKPRTRNFLKIGLATRQNERATAAEMLNHPWLKDLAEPRVKLNDISCVK